MLDIESKISPLVQSMFPSFYMEEGDNFVAFVKAYYEWLEQNHQLLDLEDITNFNVGDTIQQADVTGTIIGFVDQAVLILVDGLDTFKCYNICSELIPVTSSSGGNTYIKRGGATRRLGIVFLARKLAEMRDIDRTLDLFILRFKEKYLKNIEFDIRTNKQLLVKNSLDLYRSKGTSRSIDLFFRLVYGVKAEVYYPGDDLFRLSDGSWVKPQYLEITSSSARAVDLVGKQIVGVTSGATAFVEKFVKRKIKDGFVYVLYISNITGEFVNREILRSTNGVVYPDSPTVVGSLTSVIVNSGGKLFSVGDIVSFISTRGDHGLARVAAVSNKTGVVDFILIDGGWGYTDSADPTFSAGDLAKRTQSIVSEKVVTLSNVAVTNSVSSIVINSGGTGYSNSDIAVVPSLIVNAIAKISTNSTGGITSLAITNTGSGYTTSNPTVLITNSTGGSTTGSTANLIAYTTEQSKYFRLLETFQQRIANVNYVSASNSALLAPGSVVRIGNSTVNNAFGTILSNANNTIANANGDLVIHVANGSFGAGNTIYLVSNSSINAVVNSTSDSTATSLVMGIPNTAVLQISGLTGGTITRDQEVYQLNANNDEIGNAVVTLTDLTITGGSINVSQLNGVFRQGLPLRVRNTAVVANTQLVQITVGLFNVVENYTNSYSVPASALISGTTGNVVSISSGDGASFKIANTLSEVEQIFINSDLLNGLNVSNTAYMQLPISSFEYGFPKNPAGNSASIIYSCLTYDNFRIGSISSLTAINPGTDYNVDPYVLAYQPIIAGFDRKDYIINIANSVGVFSTDERILQANQTLSTFDLVVDNDSGYTLGEKVYQGTIGSETATGIVQDIVSSANTITVKDTTGTFANSTQLSSYINSSATGIVLTITGNTIISTAKGIVKYANTSVVGVKRIQFENQFIVGQQIVGQQSGATATITSVVEDETTLPIGLNAQIQANVVTANGFVTSLQIVDSGVGYKDNEEMLFTSESGQTGAAIAVVEGMGTGSGYYKSSKGFLSSISKVHDGDYYQEYSYEVLSRIPLERYGDMFKKVMHTAGTRYFGGVLIADQIILPVAYANSVTSVSVAYTQQFNSNSSIINGAINFGNMANSTVLKFTSGDKITYYTSGGNSAVYPLANSTNYYVANANTTAVKLVTNPRAISHYVDSSNSVYSNSISIARHNFVNNDYVKYIVAGGNTAITGLSNSSNYFIVNSTGSSIQLSTTRGGAPIALTNQTVTQNGHSFEITTINIIANSSVSGVNANGHFITQVNEA